MTKEAARKLPAHKPYDHAIDIKDGHDTSMGTGLCLSEKELETLREWLKEMLETGKIDDQNLQPPHPYYLFQRRTVEVYDCV